MTPDPIYKEIGAVIRDRRKKLGLSQEKLAAQLRISRGSLANIEIGRQNILVHQLCRFANALELAPADLLPASPANDARLLDSNLPLPGNLKPNQKAQVIGIFSEPAVTASKGEERRAKSAKH